jgi:hypothetical protein
MKKEYCYYVLSTSVRPNTFGYFGVILMNLRGHAVEALYSPYRGGLPSQCLRNGLPEQGTCVSEDLASHGFEFPQWYAKTTPAKARRVIKATLARQNQNQKQTA